MLYIFRKQYLNIVHDYTEYDLFVKAWMAYHEAANLVDGHLPPGHRDQAKLGHLAVQAGLEAMKNIVGFASVNPFKKDSNEYKTWQSAKFAALRRIEGK